MYIGISEAHKSWCGVIVISGFASFSVVVRKQYPYNQRVQGGGTAAAVTVASFAHARKSFKENKGRDSSRAPPTVIMTLPQRIFGLLMLSRCVVHCAELWFLRWAFIRKLDHVGGSISTESKLFFARSFCLAFYIGILRIEFTEFVQACAKDSCARLGRVNEMQIYRLFSEIVLLGVCVFEGFAKFFNTSRTKGKWYWFLYRQKWIVLFSSGSYPHTSPSLWLGNIDGA